MHCLPDKQAENYFNSRPREGCDSAFAYRNRHTAASTHAPARGATYTSRYHTYINLL